MEQDLKTTWDRIGWYRNTYLKIARAVIFAGLITMFAMMIATLYANMETSKLNAYIALKTTIYENIKH